MKTIFITGASSGFGKLAVEELLSGGHRVLAAVRGGQERAATIYPNWIGRPELQIIDVDLLKPEQITRAVAEVSRLCGGKLDVLVNNAGYGLFGMCEDISPAEIREQFDVNFFAPMELTRALTPLLIAAQGRIINITSVVGLITLPMYAAYCATKHALESITESLYYELKPHGVQVCAIEPGGFQTNFGKGSRKLAARSQDPQSRNQQRTQRFIRFLDTRMSRLPDPAPVARLLRRVCEKQRIRVRYPIGVDARMSIVLKKILPDSWRVRLIEWIFRRFVTGAI